MKLLQIARIATKSKRDMRNLELITSSEKLDDLEFKMAKKYNCKIWRTELHKVIAYYCAKNNIDYGEYLAKGNNGIRTNKFLFDFLVKNLKKHNVNSIKKLKIKKFAKNYNVHVYIVHSFLIYYFLRLKEENRLKRNFK